MPPRNLPMPERQIYFSRIWSLVRKVPPGKVTTYGQLARLVDPPEEISEQDYRTYGARWVGQAMRECPAGVPWQRVINSQGKISLPGAGGVEQRQRLEEEGVVFNASGKIDLKLFGWDGPNENSM